MDWRLRRWRLWFLALMTANPLNPFPIVALTCKTSQIYPKSLRIYTRAFGGLVHRPSPRCVGPHRKMSSGCATPRCDEPHRRFPPPPRRPPVSGGPSIARGAARRRLRFVQGRFPRPPPPRLFCSARSRYDWIMVGNTIGNQWESPILALFNLFKMRHFFFFSPSQSSFVP